MVLTLIRMLSSPRLYWVHNSAGKPSDGIHYTLGQPYVPNSAESWGQSLCSSIKFLLELGLYTSPLWLLYYNRRLEALLANPRLLAEVCVGISCLYFFGAVLRACGRYANPTYGDFEQVFRAAKADLNPRTKAALRGFDFDFVGWPVEYKTSATLAAAARQFAPRPAFSGILDQLFRAPAFLLINTFGLKMIYPGSTRWLFQNLLAPALTEGRAKLVHEKNGERFKLATADGNHIDAMFFDRRGQAGKGGAGDPGSGSSSNGERLVITCEGNAGFYEAGMVNVPLGAGYSVIGWNHPGFWGSTGSPLPEQDALAADAVVQFATNKLGFKLEDVSVYGWSIGGFTASWIGMNYKGLGAMVLDATFDHVLPLAIPRMPAVLENVVSVAVHDNVNLAVSDQVARFPGPVRLIRRSSDEMISTDESNALATNRGNFLLRDILSKRYPKIFVGEFEQRTLIAYLTRDRSRQEELLRQVSVDAAAAKLASYVEDNAGAEYPLDIGEDFSQEQRTELVLYLADLYLTDFDSTHCTQLPSETFEMLMVSARKKSSVK